MPSPDEIRRALSSPATMDRLAAIEHQRWAHWQQYLHDHCTRLDDGSLVIPPELASRWERQIATPYNDLTDGERESDRDQVRGYLPTILGVLGAGADAVDDA